MIILQVKRIPRKINLSEVNRIVNKDAFTFSLNKVKLFKEMKKEGKYLLKSNLTATDLYILHTIYE